MPVVIDGVEMDGRFVEELRERACDDTTEADECEGKGFALFCEVRVQEEADGKAGEGERGPWEKRKEPGLRLVEDVDAIDIGLERPGKKFWTMRSPKRRS